MPCANVCNAKWSQRRRGSLARRAGPAFARTLRLLVSCALQEKSALGQSSFSGQVLALGVACTAHVAPENDESVRQVGPLAFREAGGDVFLDFLGRRIGFHPIIAPVQSRGHANHMRVYGESGHAERVAEHHVRGFAPHPQAGRSNLSYHSAPYRRTAPSTAATQR